MQEGRSDARPSVMSQCAWEKGNRHSDPEERGGKNPSDFNSGMHRMDSSSVGRQNDAVEGWARLRHEPSFLRMYSDCSIQL
jgi:hypothetical protein